MHSYVHTFIHTYIHSFIHTYIHTYIQRDIRRYRQTDRQPDRHPGRKNIISAPHIGARNKKGKLYVIIKFLTYAKTFLCIVSLFIETEHRK